MSKYSAEIQRALNRALEVKAAREQELFRIPGVHAVSVQPKTVKGRRTTEFAIVVFVARKKPAAELHLGEVVPPVLEGVKTDVVESAPLIVSAGGGVLTDDNHYAHLLGGAKIVSDGMSDLVAGAHLGPVSIQHFVGTAGCVAISQDPAVTDPSKKFVALTCAHVLLEVVRTTTHDSNAVGQPDTSSLCCKSCDHTIGHTDHDVLLTGFDPNTNPQPPPVTIDAGFVTLDPEIEWAAEVIASGRGDSITTEQIAGAHQVGPEEALFNMATDPPTPIYAVHKRGVRTEDTKGWLLSINTSGPVQYVSIDGTIRKQLMFTNQLEIVTQDDAKFFCLEADSGAAILNSSRQVIGLLFAGPVDEKTQPPTIHVAANPIGDVQTKLKVLVADSTTYPGVQTVPKPGVAAHAFAKLPADRATLRQRMETARAELGGTELGGQLDTALHRHFGEIRRLVNLNKRAAAVWRRIRGPAWISEVLNCLLDRGRQFPVELEGRTLSDCFDQLAVVLRRYGSSGLLDDLATYGPELCAIAGRSYDETLALWRARRAT
jgi:hypothetical protein